ncbi:hypothetical protein L6Q79_15415 [bacterium]|nr:hypothetical protein [bacterium]NUN46668.1 tetratricopeptide repeat protein [bacterium]
MMRKNFYTMLMAALTTMSGLISCGTTRTSMLQDNPELIIALGGSSYTQLSDADKYDAAEYLVRKGQYENARVIFEDIITHNPGVVAVKYKLAQLYLKLDSVTFAEKTPKGDTYYFTKSGPELGEAVLREIYEKDPWFLPAYSELMMLEAKRQNYDGVKAIYEKAITKHKDFSTSDYRVGFLTMGNPDLADRFSEGMRMMEKGKKTYTDLYESYKSLGNIFNVQHKDTVAYNQLIRAISYRTEAIDIFSPYYHLADVCETLYQIKKEEHYKTMALQYACASLHYFPGYEPSVNVIRRLTGVAKDTSADFSKTYRAAAEAFCAGSTLPADDSVTIASGYTTVIPHSYLTEEMEAKQADIKAREIKRSRRPLLIAGGIAGGALAVLLLLSLVGGGGGSSSGPLGGGPPDFPTPQ